LRLLTASTHLKHSKEAEKLITICNQELEKEKKSQSQSQEQKRKSAPNPEVDEKVNNIIHQNNSIILYHFIIGKRMSISHK